MIHTLYVLYYVEKTSTATSRGDQGGPVRIWMHEDRFSLSVTVRDHGYTRRTDARVSWCVLWVSWRERSPLEEGSYLHVYMLNWVEVAGVEPASSGFLMGLLRAQPVESLEARPAAGVRASLQPTKLSSCDVSAPPLE